MEGEGIWVGEDEPGIGCGDFLGDVGVATRMEDTGNSRVGIGIDRVHGGEKDKEELSISFLFNTKSGGVVLHIYTFLSRLIS